MSLFKKLFEPGGIGNLSIKNRMVMASMSSATCDDEGYVTDRTIEHYVERARGGVGLIIVEFTSVMANARGSIHHMALYDDKFIEGNLKKNSLAEIWNNQNNFSYNRKFKTELLEGGCSDCDFGDLCKGGCRASNYFNTGSLFKSAFCSHLIN